MSTQNLELPYMCELSSAKEWISRHRIVALTGYAFHSYKEYDVRLRSY